MSETMLALDFGGTKLAAAVITEEAFDTGDANNALAWQCQARRELPNPPSFERDWEAAIALAHEVLAGAQPAAIGVSFGGPVDYLTGAVRRSHHVPGWEQVPLRLRLSEAFGGVPVGVDNDANAAALAEYRFGAGDYHDLAYLTVSTGVGSGLILNGMPWRGWDGMAGEVGHTVIDAAGPECLCGKRGCVERLASGLYLAQDAIAQLQQQMGSGPVPTSPLWARVQAAGGLDAATEQFSAQWLSAAADQGDEMAIALLDRSAGAIGVAIGNLANGINPERFVVGGGVAKAGDRYWHQMQAAARSTALPEVRVAIFPAALGDDAPLWGAAILARRLVTVDDGDF